MTAQTPPPALPSHHHPHIAQVSLAVPVGDFFDYLCPTDLPMVQVGMRVCVPFGSRQLIGIVTGLAEVHTSQVPIDKLKPIRAVLDDTPIIDTTLIKLAAWLSRYYHHPLGDVYAVMLPTLITQGKPLKNLRAQTHTIWQLAPAFDYDSALAQLSKTAKKQQNAIALISKHSDGISQAKLLEHHINRTTLKTLQDKQLIQAKQQLDEPTAPNAVTLRQNALTANTEQQHAIDAILRATQDNRYQAFLLNGITGSGKTEVYLQTMQHVLEQGKQVLILVPEIGLTPQTKARFDQRFSAHICVLHSGMNDSERLQGWLDCQDGQAQIIIGTRSSILYPFADLGLIIIDEAHDISYKQQDHLRYHACDVAMVRALWHKIPVVLGTATPSLEQYKLVQDGKLHELKLTQRAGNAQLAKFTIIDARIQPQYAMHRDGQALDTTFAQQTVQAMRQRLHAGEQVLVFLNRRGYAPVLICHACGWQADCPNCAAHLTFYKNSAQPHRQLLKCHHCAYQAYAPTHCPNCHSHNLDTLGAGTSQLSEHLHALFANPQTNARTYPIIQIDRDTMRKKGAWEKTLQQIHSGEPAILVGTQMIAKGHHFPNVTLVVIAQADLGFLSPDFRSPEHTAQRIIQVAGRAGRAEKVGAVYIQTLQPSNGHLSILVKEGYEAFAKQLMRERDLLKLPPYSYAALICAQSPHYDKAKHAIMMLKNSLPNAHPFAVLAPIDAPMAKKNNRYFVQMLILSKQRKQLHDFLDTWWHSAIALPSSKAVRLSLDIDPMGW